MNDDVAIPRAFFCTLSKAEFREILLRGGALNAEQCQRLWRMTDRQDTPPQSIKLMLNREDVMRIWPPKPAGAG